MIRSVNIFKSTNKIFPIRIEFWEDNKLIKVIECNIIYLYVNGEIEDFLKEE